MMSEVCSGDRCSMREKRLFERFEIQVPARIEVAGQNNDHAIFNLETRNLSAGGALVKFMGSLPEGSAVRVDIVLSFEELKTAADPDGSLVLSTTGHIVRSEADGIALRFDENYEFRVRLDALHQGMPSDIR